MGYTTLSHEVQGLVRSSYCSVVPVSEASVMIAVSAEHRKEALEAVPYAINQVKSTTTIWKKVRVL